jgi:hypothetical protein
MGIFGSGLEMPTSTVLKPHAVDQVTSGRIYHIVIDLNGVLVHRGVIEKGKPRDVIVRPGSMDLLNWVGARATLSFWSSVLEKNLSPIIDCLRREGAQIPERVLLLTQTSYYKSKRVHPGHKSKPIFVKDLAVYNTKATPRSPLDILLIDDSPIKNVMNDPFSAVHPPTWNGDSGDTFLQESLKPWLNGLLASNMDVPAYVKENPLPNGLDAVDKSAAPSLSIVKDLMPWPFKAT